MALTQEELNAAFGLGLEDNDLNVSVNATHEGEEDEGEDDDTLGGEIDTSDQPEAAELDLDDAADDVEEAADKVEDLEQAEQALESLYLTALNIGAESFTPATAKIFNCAVDQSLVTYGLSASDIGVASSEDFEYSPLSAYTDSMEKIGETLNTARKNAGKWIAEMWAKFVAFLTQMIDSAKRGKAKTEKLLAEGSKTKEQANEKITLAAVLGNDFTSSEIKTLNEVVASLVTTKYADIQAGLSKKGIQTKSVKDIFEKAMSDAEKHIGKTIIGGVTVKKEKGIISLSNDKRSDKSVTVKVPTVAEGILIGKELVKTSNLIIDYNGKKGARESFNKFMIKQNAEENGSTNKEDKGFFERRAVVRAAGTSWREAIAFERALIRHATAVVNSGNNGLVQIFKPKKEGKKKKEDKK